jgi:branched-chain amino acid transport system permease protein
MARVRGLVPAVALAVLLVVVPLVATIIDVPLYERVATELLINVVLVVGLQIFVGNAGIISFGHAAFMGIGAYAAVLLTIPVAARATLLPDLYEPLAGLEAPFLVALAAAALVAAVVAAGLGFPLMRLSGAGAAIATFAMLVIVQVILRQWTAVTRGTSPLFGVPFETTLWIAYVAAGLAVVVAWWFKTSRIGLQLRATREDERAAAAMGVNVVLVRWIAFVVSAMVTGVGGALWAHWITAFSVHAFFFPATFAVLMMLIIGGMRSVTGAVTGAVVVSVVIRVLREVEGGVQIGDVALGPYHGLSQLALAIIVLLMLVYRRRGLLGSSELSISLGRGSRS